LTVKSICDAFSDTIKLLKSHDDYDIRVNSQHIKIKNACIPDECAHYKILHRGKNEFHPKKSKFQCDFYLKDYVCRPDQQLDVINKVDQKKATVVNG
jgi:hypothetical protein